MRMCDQLHIPATLSLRGAVTIHITRGEIGEPPSWSGRSSEQKNPCLWGVPNADRSRF